MPYEPYNMAYEYTVHILRLHIPNCMQVYEIIWQKIHHFEVYYVCIWSVCPAWVLACACEFVYEYTNPRE